MSKEAGLVSRFKGITIEQLWPLVILAGFGVYLSLVPLAPNDFWWHLKVGEIIYTYGYVPTTNMFAWTLSPTAPFTYAAWLGELLLYILYRWGGVALPTFVRTVLTLASVWIVGWETKRRTRSWRWAALAIFLLGGMALNNLCVRPQLWSWLPFTLFLSLLYRYADNQVSKHWLFVLPVTMLFWVNLHGAFILGLILTGTFLLGETLRTALKFPNALSWHEVRWLGFVTLLVLVAILFNPQFLGVFSYVKDLLTDQPSQSLVVEWQPPTPEDIPGIIFYGTVLLMIVGLAYGRYRPTPTELLLILGLLWMAWSGQRYVIWFGMACAPIVVQILSKAVPQTHLHVSVRRWLNVFIAFLLFIPVLAVQPWFVEMLPLPETYWVQVLREAEVAPLLSTKTPVNAVNYLQLHPGGHLFNPMGYGSYLIWSIPEQGVFIDPRVELYPYEQWEDYIMITNGIRYNELLDFYGVDRIMLDVELQERLLMQLEDDPLWCREYQDPYSEVWRKIGIDESCALP